MCVKLSPGDLNPGLCPLHATNTYTCEVTIAPRVCGGTNALIKSTIKCSKYNVTLTLIDELHQFN